MHTAASLVEDGCFFMQDKVFQWTFLSIYPEPSIFFFHYIQKK